MSKAKVKRNDHGDGADFINTQRSIDEAKNERLKAEGRADQINKPENRDEHTTTVSKKKTGGGHSKSLGD